MFLCDNPTGLVVLVADFYLFVEVCDWLCKLLFAAILGEGIGRERGHPESSNWIRTGVSCGIPCLPSFVVCLRWRPSSFAAKGL
ncbi:hypothetical protein K239x_25700 [Planctomycetes bacterium K23_9]|uniref:Uncharacterized protein n=1 Tax=Stieleria marina TaxID=1930275 RepID=A0A517NU20_9BACT|nr:hypothetical protein K239x_25700 [Planctomycetes bacterium K23_9]